jgi:hypothetical protein
MELKSSSSSTGLGELAAALEQHLAGVGVDDVVRLLAGEELGQALLGQLVDLLQFRSRRARASS